MFCQKCGAQVPDGFAFCSECGSQVAAQPQAQPVYQPQYQPQSVYQPQPQYTYPPQPPVQQESQHKAVTPVKKKEFLVTRASDSCKRSSLFATIISIVGVLLMVAGVCSAILVPFYEVPAMDLILDMAEADPDELVEELEEDYNEAALEYEYMRDGYTGPEQQALDILLEAMEKLVDNFSVVNILGALSDAEEAWRYAPHLMEDYVEDAEVIRQGMLVIIVACATLYLLPLLFILLGGLKKSGGLTIAGLVLVLLPQICLGGWLLTLASLVLGIVQAVLCGKVNKAYDRYRNKCLYGH